MNRMQITEFSAHISQSVKEIPAAWRTGVHKQQTEENPAPPLVDWLWFDVWLTVHRNSAWIRKTN